MVSLYLIVARVQLPISSKDRKLICAIVAKATLLVYVRLAVLYLVAEGLENAEHYFVLKS